MRPDAAERATSSACLEDRHGRRLDYLRVSVTDLCNFRCTYCHPASGFALQPRDELLSSEEIERLCRIFARLGVRKIRLTGGEPLLRRDLVPLVERLRCIEGIASLALTTNGARLSALARRLADAGLDSVNVSLDSLDRQRFERITGRDEIDLVLRGIETALTSGLAVKVNVVAMRDLERAEVLAFCEMAERLAIEVRFIEFMPLCGTAWRPDLVLPLDRVRSWIEEERKLEPATARGARVAESFRFAGGAGGVGFIASLTDPFCGACNRIRMTASGRLGLCLFSQLGVDLRGPLRRGAPDEEIAQTIRQSVWQKPKGAEEFQRAVETGKRSAGSVSLPSIRLLGG
ncbi:MAG: GTP 3',8-cyclase MoaA [Candidatus Eisenbacteria bacterium]|nr:GTP 3',8-cyclase MoaA [Candidatus Eisenbacteria bacterium]